MLVVEDLTIEYTRGGYAVRPIDGLEVRADDGELVILLGPSGSGKTTLLSCLAALLTPAKGTIRVRDIDVTALKGPELAKYRRDDVGIVFQAFNLIPSLTAKENVAVPLRLAKVPKAEANAKAEELLVRVGLRDRMDHRPEEMSGGQQQRVAIARALVHEPPLIVADEPTANLDYMQVEEVLILIREVAAPGRLVVVATHDDRFSPLADRVIELVPGKDEPEPEIRRLTLGAGETVFEQGDPSDGVYVVEEGGVVVFRRRADGTEEILKEYGPGGYFGEIGPLLRLPRTASARTTQPSRLTAMGLSEFRRWSG